MTCRTYRHRWVPTSSREVSLNLNQAKSHRSLSYLKCPSTQTTIHNYSVKSQSASHTKASKSYWIYPRQHGKSRGQWPYCMSSFQTRSRRSQSLRRPSKIISKMAEVSWIYYSPSKLRSCQHGRLNSWKRSVSSLGLTSTKCQQHRWFALILFTGSGHCFTTGTHSHKC